MVTSAAEVVLGVGVYVLCVGLGLGVVVFNGSGDVGDGVRLGTIVRV